MTKVRKRRNKTFATACVTILLSSYLVNEPSFNVIDSFIAYADTYYSYNPEEDCYVTVVSNVTTSKDTSSSTKTSSAGASNTTNNVDFSEAMIKWFEERKGKVTYSMSSRDGQNSYDCSSSIYYALRSAGGTDNGYAVTTETEHDYLAKNNYEIIYEGEWSEHGEFSNVQAGDIFIWGKKGESAGALGHTGIFKDEKSILHCNYGGNGITENEYESYKKSVPNHKYVYIYRNKNAKGKKKLKLAPNEKECMPECNTGGSPDSSNTNTPNNTSSTGAGTLAETIDKFVKEHEEAYLLSWKAGGFLPSASIVQTIAETSFSMSVPSFAQAHNMGGVKFSGQPYTATKKLYGNDAVSANGAGTNVGDGTGGSYAYFKHFDAGIVGKAEFMATQTLYQKAINNTDGISTLEAIADGGWATDPNYKNVLKKLYETYGSRYKWLDEKAISKHGSSPYKKGDADGLSASNSDEDISCDPDYVGSGGDGWQKKGGSLGYNGVMYWRADNLPDEVKKYALDPKSIGMAWKNGKGWEGASNYISSGITDQCTTFSVACIGALWQKDNKNLGAFGLNGNGNQLVGQAEQKWGVKHSKTPTSGDITSLSPNHTSIVSHVFENGDILVVEQNMKGYSGQGSGEPFTWSYAYIPVANQKSENYTFINPSSIGYKVNPKAKSVG